MNPSLVYKFLHLINLRGAKFARDRNNQGIHFNSLKFQDSFSNFSHGFVSPR